MPRVLQKYYTPVLGFFVRHIKLRFKTLLQVLKNKMYRPLNLMYKCNSSLKSKNASPPLLCWVFVIISLMFEI